MPVDPGRCEWVFPDPASLPPGQEIAAVGADLEPATLLTGYRHGLFPMPSGKSLHWWSPDPRGVLPVESFRASRSLRRSIRSFQVSIDADFDQVVARCADPKRPQGWITPAYAQAYRRLADLGWAHSIEVWAGGELAGGLLGVEVGGLLSGESMFYTVADGSKAAVWATVTRLRAFRDGQHRLFDVQWTTPHLASLGATDIDRADYLSRLAVARSLPPVFDPMPRVAFVDFLTATGLGN